MAWFHWPRKKDRPSLPFHASRKKRSRLGFDLLEDRTVPSTTTLVSTALPTDEGNAPSVTSSSRSSSFSDDGRYLVFTSEATNLVAGATNGQNHVYRADLQLGTLTLVSAALDGTQGTHGSFEPSISGDGRYVAFMSLADNLAAGDINATADIYVKDMTTGDLTLVSASAAGALGDNLSYSPAISRNGQYVVFTSLASNLAPADDDFIADIFRKDFHTGAIDLVSSGAFGKGNDESKQAAITTDGRYIVFASLSDNFTAVDVDQNVAFDLFRKDMTTGELTLVSANAAGVIGDNASQVPSISDDGVWVVFESDSANLVAGDGNARRDIFRKNVATGAITRLSVGPGGVEANDESFNAFMTPNGGIVTFTSKADNLVANDLNLSSDVFIANVGTGTVGRRGTTPAGGESLDGAEGGVLSPDGSRLAFWSISEDLTLGDNNGRKDLFVKNLSTEAVTIVSKGALATIGSNNNSLAMYGRPQLSHDGRYVSFVSTATNLVTSADLNGAFFDVFRHDRLTGQTIRISENDTGTQGNGDSVSSAIGNDGSWIVFHSASDNLFDGDENLVQDVFLKDTASGMVYPLSVSEDGYLADNESFDPVLSRNGRYVVFTTYASNLFSDTTSFADVVVTDLLTGKIAVASAKADGSQGQGDSAQGSISDDGRFVVFISNAALTPDDTNGKMDVYRKDLVSGAIVLVSKPMAGGVGNGNASIPVISGDGRYVAFVSGSTNLVEGDTNSVDDIFLADLQAGTIVRVNQSAAGQQANGASFSVGMSQNGRFLTFESDATNLVAGDTAIRDVFWKDMQTGAIVRVSVSNSGEGGDQASFFPSISGDGRHVAYTSLADNLSVDDRNNFQDVYATTVNTTPVVETTGPYSIAPGESLHLDASGSTDADGESLTYTWDLNGDGTFGDAEGAVADLTWAQLQALGITGTPGPRPIKLRVSDAVGGIESVVNLTIESPPILNAPLTGPANVAAATNYILQIGAIENPDDVVISSYVIHWGDGQTTTGTGLPPSSATHQYTEPANQRTITLELIDDASISHTAGTLDVVVAENLPPTIVTTGPYVITVGDALHLNASGTTDPESDSLTYLWDINGDGAADAEGAIVDLTWAQLQTLGINGPGTITMALQVADAIGPVVVSVGLTVEEAVAENLAPTIVTTGPYVLVAGNTLHLDASDTTDPENDPLTFTWDINGDGVFDDAVGATPSLTWAQLQALGIDETSGGVVVTLRVTDAVGPTEAVISLTIQANQSPTATLSGNSAIVGATYTLHVSDLQNPDNVVIASYIIHWGDGATSTGVGLPPSTATHVYGEVGNHVISLELLDDVDASYVAGTIGVAVATEGEINDAPNIVTTGPYVVSPGGALHLDASATTDPENDPLTFSWDINGDGVFGDAVGATVNLSWAQLQALGIGASSGAVVMALRVVDAGGPSDITVGLTVQAPVSPTASLTGPASVAQDATYALQIGSISNPSALVIAGFVIHWGDGTSTTGSGLPPASASHIYTSAAERTITLELIDDAFASHVAGSNAITVTAVVNAPPQIATTGPYAIFAGAALHLDASGTTDPENDPLTFTWDINGDSVFGDATGATPNLTWAQLQALGISATTGAVIMKVRASDGVNTATTQVNLTVQTPATPTVALTGAASVDEGSTYTLAIGTLVNPDSLTIASYVIEWGDGQTSTGTGTPSTPMTHVYGDGPATRAITLKLIDSLANVHGAGTHGVTVVNVAPVVSVGDDVTLHLGETLNRTITFVDPGADAWSGTITFGDGQTQEFTPTDKSFSFNHKYAATGSYSVTVTIHDDDGGANSASFTVTQTFDLNLTPATIAESAPNGTTVGTLTTGGATSAIVFTLVDDDGGRFAVNGGTIVVANGALLDFEAEATRTISVKAVSDTQEVVKEFAIQLTDVREGDSIVGRDPETGRWYVARSTGTSFVTSDWGGAFPTARTWIDLLVADFTGDGLEDLAARDAQSGAWWLARSTGSSFVAQEWDAWSPQAAWSSVMAVDFDGDGRADLLGRDLASGNWYASFSKDNQGATSVVGTWDPAIAYTDVQAADMNGDGRPDLIGRVGMLGVVHTLINQPGGAGAMLSTRITSRIRLNTGNLPNRERWNQIRVADTNGDGAGDLIGFEQTTGRWYVSIPGGAVSTPRDGTPFSTWKDVVFADVKGDKTAEVLGRTDSGSTSTWWLGAFKGEEMEVTSLGTITGPILDVLYGDFSGDERTDVAVRRGNGEWHVGVMNGAGTAVAFSVWEAWPTDPWRDFARKGRFSK